VVAQDAQRVEITGSAIKRIEAEGSLPVQVITREEISRSGVANTEQLLQSLPTISSMGAISTTLGAGLSTYGRSEVSLRGLGSERTLVLVNGRRLAAFAGGGGAAVNINTIPLAAIERVDILRDGASALYGSDAIAGVVNFILRKDYTGAEIEGTYNKPTRRGGGDSGRVSIVGGFGDLNTNRFNVTVSASKEKERELHAAERSFARTGNIEPYIFSGATGQGNIEGGIDPVTGATDPGFGGSPGTGYGNPLAALGRCEEIRMFRNPFDTTRGFPFCAYDSAQDVRLLPDRDADNLSANLTFKLTDNLELFGDALYGKSVVTQRIQPSPVRRSFLVTDALFADQGVVPALILDPSNPNYAVAAAYLTSIGQGALVGRPLAITSRVFDFGPRTSHDTAEQTRFVAGARGTAFDQDWEVALSRNESKTEGEVIAGYFSQIEFVRAVNAPGSDWNPWSLTQSDAFNSRIAAAEYIGPTLSAKSTSTVLDGTISGDLFKLPAGPSRYAVGAQVRDEKYVTTPSPALGTGDIAGLGGATPPVNRGRRIDALFAEVSAPLLKSLEGTVSVRGDRYDDVGSSTTYKAHMKWSPVRWLGVRASYGTGFRAPTLEDLWSPQVLGASEQFTDPVTGQANLQVNALTGGNENLKPEKSKQHSLGLIFQPIDSLSVGLDFFWIKVKDIINTPTAQEVVSGFRSGNPVFASSVTLTPSGDIDFIEQLTVNSGDAKVAGVDLDARYRMDLAGGKLDLNLFGTYMSKFDETSPGGVVSHKVGTTIDADGNPVLGAGTGGVVLRWKHRLSATWSTGPWAFTLAQNYTHGYETGLRQFDGERNFMKSQSLYDAQVAYTGVKNLRLAVGVKNLFDKDPPGIFVPVSNQFQAGYDVTQYDARARFWYVSAGYKFF
jgi:iron complex outermembrane receptor protein